MWILQAEGKKKAFTTKSDESLCAQLIAQD
jgi:hypothetical protein